MDYQASRRFTPNTPDEMLIVVQAFKNGKELEVNVWDGGGYEGWRSAGQTPTFNFGWCRYRVKWMPKKLYGATRSDGKYTQMFSTEEGYIKAQQKPTDGKYWSYTDYDFFSTTEDTPANLSDPLTFTK